MFHPKYIMEIQLSLEQIETVKEWLMPKDHLRKKASLLVCLYIKCHQLHYYTQLKILIFYPLPDSTLPLDGAKHLGFIFISDKARHLLPLWWQTPKYIQYNIFSRRTSTLATHLVYYIASYTWCAMSRFTVISWYVYSGCIHSEYNKGLSTQPCRAPVFITSGDDGHKSSCLVGNTALGQLVSCTI